MRTAGGSGRSELTSKSAFELAQLVRSKEVTASEVLAAHLALVERLNPALNAICTVAAEQAQRQARAIDASIMRREAVGPLAGVPIGISDTTLTAGIRTTYGSPMYKDHVPSEDAEVVKRLSAAGAIILGKTNVPEFGAGAHTTNALSGATSNPWNLECTAGGSAGGGAAAVASGMMALAEGTDFAGGVRVPAAFCGLVGLRPTAGLIPAPPGAQPWDVKRVEGALGRSAEDTALALDTMLGISRQAPLSTPAPWSSAFDQVSLAGDLKGVRIGFVPDVAAFGTDAEIARLTRKAAFSLTAFGAEVEDESLNLSDGVPAYLTLRGQWMVTQYYEHLDELDRFGAALASNIQGALRLTAPDIARAERKRAQLWERARAFLERCDLLATPTTPCLPFKLAEPYPAAIGVRRMTSYIEWIAPTFLITMIGLPAVSVPAGLSASGLPVGLQLVGPRFSEPRLLRAAKYVQKASPVVVPHVPSIPRRD